MFSFPRHRVFLFCVALGAGAFLASLPAHAASTQFFIDPSYDDSGRDVVTATGVLDGNHAHFYVEDSFLDSLSPVGQQQLLYYTQKLSNDFDSMIYPNETYVFGNEWKPGIDNDLKIYILLTPMKDSAGGYFRPQDEQPISEVAKSNQREILYVNARLLAYPHLKEFLAHEFQHLINYNQKVRARGFQDDVWLNEMMSEVAPMVAGIYKESNFSYAKSNIHDRVITFLDSPNDDVLDWSESVQDYASISLLGYYLYEHYSPQLFTALEQSDKTGVPALDEALQKIGANKTFEQIFSDWTVATILNDCSVAPHNFYCYTDSFLNHDNLSIKFRRTQISNSQVSFDKQETGEWAGNWFRYTQPLPSETQSGSTPSSQSASPPSTYLNFSFSAPSSSTDFLGWYVTYHADGTKIVHAIPFSQNAALWSVPNFGTDAQQIDVVFSDFFHKSMTLGNPFFTQYNLDATLDDKSSATALTTAALTATTGNPIHDGDLIRVTGDSKIYVVQGSYKRWIQSAAIFNSYGNLHWENVQEISAETAAQYLTSSLVHLLGDSRVFREDADDTKHWIANEAAFLDNGYKWDMIFMINQREFNLLPTGYNITS